MAALRALLAELNPLDNPLVVRDLRSRMRGLRLFLLIVLCQSAVLVTLASLWGITGSLRARGVGPELIAAYGHRLLVAVMVVQAFMVCLVVPAMAAGAFTSEREKLTLDMLRLTRLSGMESALGKAAGPFLVAGLLLLTSLPAMAVCMLFGGVSLGEVGFSILGLLLFSGLFASGAVALSAAARSTASAVVCTELVALALLLIGAADAIFPHTTAVSGLTPLSWVLRVCAVQDLSCPLLNGSVPFIIPSGIIVVLGTLFLLVQGPVRLVRPLPHHLLLKRLLGIGVLTAVLVAIVWGFWDPLLASALGTVLLLPFQPHPNDAFGVLALVSMMTTLLVSLYANASATGRLDSLREKGALRAILSAFHPRRACADGVEAGLAWAIVGWLAGVAVLLGAIALTGESIGRNGYAAAGVLLAAELAVIVVAYLMGLAASLGSPGNRARGRNRGVAAFVAFLLYPALVLFAWGVVSAVQGRTGLSGVAWLCAPSPGGFLVVLASSGASGVELPSADLGGWALRPWHVGAAVHTVLLIGLIRRVTRRSAELTSERRARHSEGGASGTGATAGIDHANRVAP